MAYQKDISAILGLSISTVSKALKGYPDISEETRQKVLKTAEDLQYRFHGTSNKGKEHPVGGAVGLIAPELVKMLDSGYYRSMLRGMTEEAARENRDLVIMGAEAAAGGMSWGVRSIARRVDGLCILAREEDFYRGRFAQILDNNFPVVSIEHEAAGHIAVCSRHRQNIRMLLAYLKSMGHRQIAVIVGHSAESRRTAAIVRSEAENLAMSVRETDRDGLMAAEAVRRAKARRVTCVVFEEYREAERAIQRWKRAGWKVPADISAAALEGPYDGPYDSLVTGRGDRITCIQTGPRKIGSEAIRRLIEITVHPEMDSGERILVNGELCTGETVAASARNALEKFK